MKLTCTLALCLVAAPALAQTAAHRASPAHRSTVTGACITLPEMSPKIPALPAGSPCAKALYSVTTMPPARLENVSPMEGPALQETLGLESSSFTLGYVDTKVGTGELAPPHKWYTIDYTGYLVDGTKFDSSVGKTPISIPYGDHRVILGWDTGFAGMHVGGKRRLFIPFQLAYGAQGRDKIPPRAELVFDVELLKISDSDPTPKPATAPVPPPASNPINTPPAAQAKPATPSPVPPAAATPPSAAQTTPKPQQ